MTTALKSISSTVQHLPITGRAALAEHRLAGIGGADLEDQWKQEARRRRDEIRSGKVKPIPAATVYRRIERLLAK